MTSNTNTTTGRSNGRPNEIDIGKQTMGKALEMDNQRQSLEEIKGDVEQMNDRDNSENDDVNWVQLRLEGRQPERRAYHSTFEHDNVVYIYGGHDIREGQMNSLWALNMNAVGNLKESSGSILEWQLKKTYGNKTPGKYILLSN